MFKGLKYVDMGNGYQFHTTHALSGYFVSMDNDGFVVQHHWYDFSDKTMSLKKKLEEIHQQCIKLMSI